MRIVVGGVEVNVQGCRVGQSRSVDPLQERAGQGSLDR